MTAARGTEISITFGLGFTHDLGKPCETCHANEAHCAYIGGCCATCTHPFGKGQVYKGARRAA